MKRSNQIFNRKYQQSKIRNCFQFLESFPQDFSSLLVTIFSVQMSIKCLHLKSPFIFSHKMQPFIGAVKIWYSNRESPTQITIELIKCTKGFLVIVLFNAFIQVC